MLTWLLYALVALAILALLPMIVLVWWDVVERWRVKRHEAQTFGKRYW